MDATERANTQGRLIGLGQNPSDDVAAAVFQMGFTQVPVIEYVTWTTQVPLTDQQITATFGDEIDVLQNPKSVVGIDSVDSSFVMNGLLQVDMLVVGFGVHAFGEPLSFSTIGNSVAPAPAPGTASIMSPDVFTQNDLANGALGPTTGVSPADMEWGVADWEAMWHLMQAYQFQWIMQQRYLLINELAADVAYFGPYAEAQASGTSEVPIQEYVRQINNRYRQQAGGGIFAPVNARRVGSVNVHPAAGATNVGVFHPTRDFDLAPVTWGGIRNTGGAACCSPFRKLQKPVLLDKGIRIGMLLRVQDTYHQQQMQKFLSISDAAGGSLANVQYDANMNGVSNGASNNTGAINTFLELTLDPGATNSFANQQVQTDRILYKGGCLKLAILIKGLEVWGPWKDYLRSSSQVSQLGAGPVGILPAMR